MFCLFLPWYDGITNKSARFGLADIFQTTFRSGSVATIKYGTNRVRFGLGPSFVFPVRSGPKTYGSLVPHANAYQRLNRLYIVLFYKFLGLGVRCRLREIIIETVFLSLERAVPSAERKRSTISGAIKISAGTSAGKKCV